MLKQVDTLIAFSVVMLLLSLIVTALVQAVSAVFDLRGRNLAVALTNLLRHAAPELRDDAELVARRLCRHSAVAAGWYNTAKALRVDEVTALLRGLDSDPTLDAGLKARLAAATSGVSTWFDAIMGRSSDRFASITRHVTVALSFLLAFGLHVDALALLRQLTTDEAVRAALVARATETLQTAEDMSSALPVAAAMADPATDAQVAAALKALTPSPSTCRAAVDSLRKEPLMATSAVDAFQKTCWDKTVTHLGDTRARFDRVMTGLDLDGLRLFEPWDAGGLYWLRPSATTWAWGAYRRTLMGTLMTALFVSLGAPFWFNSLRQLSNLRPILSNKVEQETLARR